MQLLPLALEGGDLDGGLLLTEESQWFSSSFEWGQGEDYGSLITDPSLVGIGSFPKHSPL